MGEHLTGHPVNASTYNNHGCRCDGCRKAHTASCYQSWARRAASQPCTVEACDRGVYARELCRAHYARTLRGGEPGGVIGERRRTSSNAQRPLREVDGKRSTHEVAAIVGTSYRRLIYWVRRGYIPGLSGRGSGHALRWSAEHVRRACALVLAAGIRKRTLGEAADLLTPLIAAGAELQSEAA